MKKVLFLLLLSGPLLHGQWSISNSDLNADFISDFSFRDDSTLFFLSFSDLGNFGVSVDDLIGIDQASGSVKESYSIPNPTVANTRSAAGSLLKVGALIVYDTIIHNWSSLPNPTVSEHVFIDLHGNELWRVSSSKPRLVPKSNYNSADSSMWFSDPQSKWFTQINLYSGDTLKRLSVQHYLAFFGLVDPPISVQGLVQPYLQFSSKRDTGFFHFKKPAIFDSISNNWISDDTAYFVLFQKSNYSISKVIRRPGYSRHSTAISFDLFDLRFKNFAWEIDTANYTLTQYFIRENEFSQLDTVLVMDTLWMPKDPSFENYAIGFLSRHREYQLVRVNYLLPLDSLNPVYNTSSNYIRLYQSGVLKFEKSFGIKDGLNTGFENWIQQSLICDDGSVILRLKGVNNQYLLRISPQGNSNFDIEEERKLDYPEVTVFPTKTQHNVIFRCDQLVSRIEIYDSKGSLLRISLPEALDGQVDMRSFKDGWYVLKLYSGGNIMTFRVLKLD